MTPSMAVTAVSCSGAYSPHPVFVDKHVDRRIDAMFSKVFD